MKASEQIASGPVPPDQIYGWSAARLEVERSRSARVFFDLADEQFHTLSGEAWLQWINHPDRRYIVSTARGDEFLEKIEAGPWETIKVFFTWTKDSLRALRWTRDDVRKSFHKVVADFSAPQLICVR